MASRRELVVFGVGVGAILAAFGGWRYFADDAISAAVLGGAALLLVLSGALAPGLLRPVHAGWLRVVAPVAWFNTRLLLALVYFGILLPTGLVRRWLGDPLQLRERRGARPRKSHWVDRDGARDHESYRRQV